MKAASGKQLLNGIVVAICIVLAIAVLSIWQYQRIRDTGADIRHLDQVLYGTGELATTEMQYELAVKNFLLTNDSSYGAVAEDSARSLPGKMAALKSLLRQDPAGMTADDSLAVAQVDTLKELVESEMGRGHEGWKFGSIAAGGELHAAAVKGKSVEIRAVVARIINQQRGLLEERRQRNQARASELQWALWVLGLTVLAMGVVLFRRVWEQQRKNLQRSEERYKTIFEKSPLPKWIFDEETLKFLEVNEAAVRLYGYSKEEFRKLTLADIRPPEDLDALMADIGNVRRDPQAYQVSEWRHLRKNGEMIDVEVTAHSVELDGRQARMVAIVDMTERRRNEQQLQRLNADMTKRAAELAASNSELERFAYIASHDLQEPLRMVSSFLQLLQKKYAGQLDARADQYIHYAVDGAERMKTLIMDLLEYSRVGTGGENFGWVECSEVMDEVGATFRERVITAKAQLEIGELPRIWADKVQVGQLLQNLLSNALKYAGDRPPAIRISADERKDFWQFAVADNGIGIDPQFFDKIFIIFQRLHNKSDYSGTGIGLAICKKIVERHGGRIWVESDRRTGSTFYFTIRKNA